MHPVDGVVIVLYLAGVFALGIACRGRQRTVDAYFTSHGAFTGPLGSALIGLSIAASYFSAISFVILSSSAYTDGAKVLVSMLSLPVAWLFLRLWFLGRYLSLPHSHPYDVVESRFGYRVRLVLSILFFLQRIGWMAVIIYAPTLVLMGALQTGPHGFWPLVVLIGASCTLLAAIGGIRALIVLDAVQFIIMASGIVFIIGTILVRLHTPVEAIWSELSASGRLRLFDFSPDLARPWTFWAVMIGMTVESMGRYSSDQVSLQRYLAAESPRAVYRSFVVNLWSVIVVCVFLVAVGLLLRVWYWHHPAAGLPSNPDQVLPYFAMRELPPGLSGLFLAAILAATINALTSGINSMAGSLTSDFIARLGRPRSPESLFRIGRVSTIVLGAVATLSAGLAGSMGSLLQSSQIAAGFLGPMLGGMIWTVSGVSVRPPAVLWGMILGSLAGCLVAASSLSTFWVVPSGFAVAFLVPCLDLTASRKPAGAVPST